MAGISAGCLWALGGATSWLVRRDRSRIPARLASFFPYLLEAGTVLALYAIWQITLDWLVVHNAGAFDRARTIYHWEQVVHLPSEAHLQHLALAHPSIVRFGNVYYADADFPGLVIGLAWLFWRHREKYRHYRLTLILTTAACALIQAIPVAPPRMLPQFGFVDTGLRFGQSVYGPGTTDPGVLTTMPSVHVAWAALVALMVCGASRWRWRWWVLAHPILTMLFVVVTGNHFWADGIVALALLGGALAVQRLGAGLPARLRAARRKNVRISGVAVGTSQRDRNGAVATGGTMLEQATYFPSPQGEP
jgi:hypothetical protein